MIAGQLLEGSPGRKQGTLVLDAKVIAAAVALGPQTQYFVNAYRVVALQPNKY